MNVATPQSELYEKLALLGWELGKVEFKNGVYVAKASNPTTSQSIDRAGKTPENAIAAVYQYAVRAGQVRRYAALKKLGAWGNHFVDRVDDIGQAYSKLPAFDPKAVPAWKALAAESKIQADAIRRQIKVEVVDDPEPYPNAQAMCEDVHKNKHFYVSRANSEHPLWSQEDNINFRIVHDVLGHCQSGGDFTWHGENLACGTHFPLVSPLAREALMTECLGQTGYANVYHGFGPQKVGFMSEFLHPAQAKEGEQVWVPHGGLPELAQAPNANQRGTMGEAPGEAALYQSPGQWINPGQYPSLVMAQPSPVMTGFTYQGAVGENPHDPNAFWNAPQQAPPIAPENDYIGIADTVDNAAKIDTEWPKEDEATQKQAIMNAFRVALLSPRKHLKWNAAHYQALMHADPATKARDLWDMLEQAREDHNQKLGYPEGSHLAYRKQLDFLADELQTKNPNFSPADARKLAKEIIFKKTKEFESILPEEDNEVSELRRYNNARRLVTDWLRQNYTPARGWQPGQMALAKEAGFGDGFGEEAARILEEADAMARDVATHLPPEDWPQWVRNNIQRQMGTKPNMMVDTSPARPKQPTFRSYPGESPEEQEERQAIINEDYQRRLHEWDQAHQDTAPSDLTFPDEWGSKTSGETLFPVEEGDWAPIPEGFSADTAKYGAFMGNHLDAIEAVGQHIDQIRKAALQDMRDGGRGFVFRNAVMNLRLPGVGPKVASFVWLLLCPMSSELGIIDTHVMRGLRRPESAMNDKDYYKFERMQRAAKDATGYGHMPLGLYHWGMWDAIRNPGEHSDHSALRILDPLPWDSPQAKWDASTTARSGPWVGPMQFEEARPYMEQVANDFDKEFAAHPKGKIPQTEIPGLVA